MRHFWRLSAIIFALMAHSPSYAQIGPGGGGGGGSSAITTWGGAALAAATAWGVVPSGNVIGANVNCLAGCIGTSGSPTIVDTVAAGGSGNLINAITAPSSCKSSSTAPGGTSGQINCDNNGNIYLAPVDLLTIGTAGSPSTQVVSIQGVASGTVVPVSGSVSGAVNVTPTDCSGTVATGGTAVNAFTAQTTLHGFTIFNTNTAEVMWISFTTTAAANTAGSYPIPAATATTFAGGGSFTSPAGMGINHALSVVAATTAHTFSCTWW